MDLRSSHLIRVAVFSLFGSLVDFMSSSLSLYVIWIHWGLVLGQLLARYLVFLVAEWFGWAVCNWLRTGAGVRQLVHLLPGPRILTFYNSVFM